MKTQTTRLEKIRRLTRPENRPICILWQHPGNSYYTLNGQPITEQEIQARFGNDVSIIVVEYTEGAIT